MKEVQEDEYESDHVSSAWNGTCFHTSMAPLKLRDGNTYTLMYTYIHREIRTSYTTVTKKNQVIYEEEQFSVKLIGFHDVTLGIMFTTDR